MPCWQKGSSPLIRADPASMDSLFLARWRCRRAMWMVLRDTHSKGAFHEKVIWDRLIPIRDKNPLAPILNLHNFYKTS